MSDYVSLYHDQENEDFIYEPIEYSNGENEVFENCLVSPRTCF